MKALDTFTLIHSLKRAAGYTMSRKRSNRKSDFLCDVFEIKHLCATEGLQLAISVSFRHKTDTTIALERSDAGGNHASRGQCPAPRDDARTLAGPGGTVGPTTPH